MYRPNFYLTFYFFPVLLSVILQFCSSNKLIDRLIEQAVISDRVRLEHMVSLHWLLQ